MTGTRPIHLIPGEYIYVGIKPEGCTGHTYRAHRIVLNIPTYQQQILMEGLTGQETGQWFTCTVQTLRTYFTKKIEEKVEDSNGQEN